MFRIVDAGYEAPWGLAKGEPAVKGRLLLALVGCVGLVTTAFGAPAAGQVATANPVDIAAQAGIAEPDPIRTFGGTIGDYDGDRDQDALILRHYPDLAPDIPRPRLWQNQLVPGGSATFVDKGDQFTQSDRHDCVWGDADKDGDEDLFCAVGLYRTSENELWLQQPDHTFRNVAAGWGLTVDTFGRFRTATFIDANGDAYPDIYVTRWSSFGAVPDPNEPYPNNLWINVPSTTQAGRGYVHAPEYGLDETIGAIKDDTSCAQAVDYNTDGTEDLLACGQNEMLLYRNNGPATSPVFTRQINFTFWKDGQLADLEGLPSAVSDPDLVMVKPNLVQVRFSNDDGTFAVPSAANKWTFDKGGENVAVGDFNGDTFPDVYVLRNCGGGTDDRSDFLLINQGNKSFSQQTVPVARTGCGDWAEAIDINNDGSDEFLVTNGNRKKPGTVQLWQNQP